MLTLKIIRKMMMEMEMKVMKRMTFLLKDGFGVSNKMF